MIINQNVGSLKVLFNERIIYMDDFIELGFQARRSCQVELELNYFRKWCEKNNLVQDETLTAEILWEMNLSKLKTRYVSVCY